MPTHPGQSIPGDERPPVARPRPPRRPLSEEEIAERLRRCYDILLEAAAEAETAPGIMLGGDCNEAAYEAEADAQQPSEQRTSEPAP
jgi:hypothetical protein